MDPYVGVMLFGIMHQGDSLSLSQTANFSLFQTESISRQQFQIWWKWQKVLQKGRKMLWDKEKLLIKSNFSSFHSFSKDWFCRHVKSRACLGKVKFPLARGLLIGFLSF